MAYSQKSTPVDMPGGLDMDKLCLGEEEDVDTADYGDADGDDFATQRDKEFYFRPIDYTFEELARDMVDVDRAGLVKKKILITGNGPVISSAATVIIHYQMFLDGVPEPFDSTRLREQYYSFTLGQGPVIPGMEEAVASMRVNELSHFLVFWAKAFGEHGNLPRIPPKANIVIEIELLDTVGGSTEGLISAKKEFLLGNELFHNKKVRTAIRHYHKAIKIYESMHHPKNAEEINEMLNGKLNLHINLACCYNKINHAAQACGQSRRALSLDPLNVNALFLHGRANMKLLNFDMASRSLNKALSLKPSDPEIIRELSELDRKRREANQPQMEFGQPSFSYH